ncbi:MAG: hypothetical protein WCJ54_02100 [Actinomycetota bacterium]
MDKRSKMSDLDIFNKTDKKEVRAAASEHVTKSFRLTKDQAELLKEYTEKIQPGHFMITEADIIRYMILNFDLKKAQEDFFKSK